MHTLARTCGADTAGQCSRHGAPCKATAGSSEVQRCSLVHPRSPLRVTAACSLQSPPALGAPLCPSPGDLIELGGCVTQPNQTGSLLPPQAPPPLPGGDPCPRPRWVLAGSGGWEGRGCALTRVAAGRPRSSSEGSSTPPPLPGPPHWGQGRASAGPQPAHASASGHHPALVTFAPQPSFPAGTLTDTVLNSVLNSKPSRPRCLEYGLRAVGSNAGHGRPRPPRPSPGSAFASA